MEEEQVSLRQSAVWGAVAFGVGLAVVIGIRLDQAALAVVVGVACGVMASIPASLLIISLLRRQDEREERRKATSKRQEIVQSLPVVVVAPPAAPQLHQPASWPEEYALPMPTQRQFSVIGEEETKDVR